MINEKILQQLRLLTQHFFIEITARGNEAINAALSLIPSGETILIPEEGGWIHYEKGPQKRGITPVKVACNDAAIDLEDLRLKLTTVKPEAFLYQNPGGYFAEQPLEAIYDLCRKQKCLVIMDVSGSIGTPLCDGRYADILVGSFGTEKVVNAGVGGFISSNDKILFEKTTTRIHVLEHEQSLQRIYLEIQKLPSRIGMLTELRRRVIADLRSFEVVHPQDRGFVVVIKYHTLEEKAKVIAYCHSRKLEFTECPRYIRLLKPAISIEIKRQ